MRLANLDAIVTRPVSPAALISALFLMGCQSVSADSGSEWQVKPFDATALHAVSVGSVDQMLVEQLIENYKKFPKYSESSELTLSRVLGDGDSGGRRYFIFDIQYVDDVSVVYVLDSRNTILERFLMSPWVLPPNQN
jgi:hypothetical protein